MQNVVKNLVIGGVDVHLREHNQKGFRVKASKNLHFNNGFIKLRGWLTTLSSFVADGGTQNHDNDGTNQIYITPPL